MRSMPVVALVDDDAIFQFITIRTIQNIPFQSPILQFSNGEEALKHMNKHADSPDQLPDIILLDINMPLIDGWMFLDAFDELKNKLSKPICIYMISSSIDPSDINRAKENPNVKDYLIKPIALDVLGNILKGPVTSLN